MSLRPLLYILQKGDFCLPAGACPAVPERGPDRYDFSVLFPVAFAAGFSISLFMSETDARAVIDRLLREAGWVLPGDDGVVNVVRESCTAPGTGFRADYILKDTSASPLCVIEAKKERINPLSGKEQARGYADSSGCRFAILSNGVTHYFRDIPCGSPVRVECLPGQGELMARKSFFNPFQVPVPPEIGRDYIAQTGCPGFDRDPGYAGRSPAQQDAFLKKNRLRLLRDYQVAAVHAVRDAIAGPRDRFLLEMATGTGKTLTSAALVKMFLGHYGVRRVLFLVDRVELENQAYRELDALLGNDFRTVIWKENRSDWKKAEIVISTVQALSARNRYRKIFRPDDFGLVISDEAHRSLGTSGRKVFEYFIGFKTGLTATPKDYLKSVDMEGVAAGDPLRLDARIMKDTYRTFGCESGTPTFRYTLADGVRDGYLVNPEVIDSRTEITTRLLSEKGYVFHETGEDGTETTATFNRSDFERKFFSENTNIAFCTAFLENAKKDPCTGETGKTLIFCVSQDHAANITRILNAIADRVFPGRYRSDFAMQVTSDVRDAQQMTVDFRNNNLAGRSTFDPYYRTSKARICVTVGMMTTGYDCTDILNICMMRPVYSPSAFIQMKGRGTRPCDFSQMRMADTREMPDGVDLHKRNFRLFDFFGNYAYFEKDFDYDKVLALPSGPCENDALPDPGRNIDVAVSTVPDPLAELTKIMIAPEGMKVDTGLYRSFKKEVKADTAIRELVGKNSFPEAENRLRTMFPDRPGQPYTIAKLGKSIGLDRLPTVREILLYVFEYMDAIPSRQECLDEDFDRMDRVLDPDDDIHDAAREVFEAYAGDETFRDIVDSGRFAELRTHPSGEAFHRLPSGLRRKIPAFVSACVDTERLRDAR